MDEKDRTRNLSVTLSQIEKQFGKGSILRLGARDAIVPVAAISTGSISVDYALGVGGLPRGRICEIFGPESSGKTTVALQVVGQAQKAGGMAAFIDVEHALDPATAPLPGSLPPASSPPRTACAARRRRPGPAAASRSALRADPGPRRLSRRAHSPAKNRQKKDQSPETRG